MPHQRPRYIEAPLKKIMGLSPLVGVLGHRQVGKTTLLERVCKKYHVLDSKTEFDAATRDPERYVSERAGSWSALDECQLVPSLFPALKEWVRTHKKPGQFVMSGSVRFTSRDAIRESLTGRIMNLELLPFSISELEGEPLSSTCLDALRAEDFKHWLHQRPFNRAYVQRNHTRMKKYFESGGLPGVCFIRDAKLREQKMEEQLLTLLDRDLRLVKKILVPYGDIRRLVEALAKNRHEPIDYTRLKFECGLSTPTIKKLLYALEATFILRFVPIEGSTQGSAVFFEDQAEGNYLARTEPGLIQNLTSFAFTNIRHQFVYRLGENIRYFQYRTRGGAFVPLCFGGKQGILGILPLAAPDEVGRHRGTLSSFLGAYGNAKLLLIHPEMDAPRLLGPRTLLVPAGYLNSY